MIHLYKGLCWQLLQRGVKFRGQVAGKGVSYKGAVCVEAEMWNTLKGTGSEQYKEAQGHAFLEGSLI